MNIFKREGLIVFIDDRGGQSAFTDLTKNA
jgi:hypothetical protein